MTSQGRTSGVAWELKNRFWPMMLPAMPTNVQESVRMVITCSTRPQAGWQDELLILSGAEAESSTAAHAWQAAVWKAG